MSPVAVAVVAAVLLAALVGMLVGWRRRGARQQRYVLPANPADTGAVLAEATGLYLATTFAGRPLDRVVAGGLGFRARTRVAVTDRGVLLDRDGAAPLLVPRAALTGAGSGTWTIDRAVEPGGLLVLGWALPTADGDPEPVESSLRLDAPDQARLLDALAGLVPALLPVPPAPDPEVPRADR